MGIDDIVLNWIRKAESDLKTAKDEIQTENPATDTICFHSQQCIEKYLKAFLTYHQKRFGKTHNIAELIELCKEIDEDFEKLYDIKAESLTPYAVEIRYPDEFYFPSLEEAKEAIKIAEEVKAFVIEKLNKSGFLKK
jgi:HEPN domain-containing protein